jgi:hypothetical protein
VKPTYYSLFLIPDEKRNIFKWSLRWMNAQYPKLSVRMVQSPERMLALLERKPYVRIYWYQDLTTSKTIAQQIQSKYPSLDWYLVAEKLDVIQFRAWMDSMTLQAIWYLPDFLYFSFCNYLVSFPSRKPTHSPSVERVLKNPKLKLEAKDLSLLEALKSGKSSEQIQNEVGFSKSNYYYHLDRLKKKFQLLPERNLYQLVKTAENWGYL